MIAAVAASVVALCFVAALWDVACRFVAAHEANLALLKRINALELEADKQHQQLQAVLGKLNATLSAQATRMPRVVQRS